MSKTRTDTGYAWVIVVASFLAQTIELGTVWTVGVYNEVFNTEFAGTSGEIALVGSLNNFSFYLLGELTHCNCTNCAFECCYVNISLTLLCI